MKVIGVIGGGISGLATCYYLTKFGKGIVDKVVLLESSGKYGGWIASEVDGSGVLFEKGPRSIRAYGEAGRNTIELVDELGLSDDILPITKSHPSTRNRFIYAHGKLNRLPNTFRSIISTNPPFTKPLLWYVLKEIFQPKLSSSPKISSSQDDDDDDDYSVDQFFRKRFGDEVADYVVNPLCRGIYAGASAKLSVKSCFRPIFEHEARFGSVVKGMLLSRKKESEWQSALGRRFTEGGWVVWSLKGGLQQLPSSLLKSVEESTEVRVEVRGEQRCVGLQFVGGGVQVHSSAADTAPLHCDHLFCALPSHESLGKIHSVDVGVVNLLYGKHVQPPYQGFGHLVPSHQDKGLLGVIYEGCTFPLHNGLDQKSRFTVMLGGDWFEESVGRVDGGEVVRRLEEMSLGGMRRHLGIREKPERVVVNVLKKCIPQYTVGHNKLLKQISNYIDNNKHTDDNKTGLAMSLVGCSYRGVSVNDCILNARKAVQTYVEGAV